MIKICQLLNQLYRWRVHTHTHTQSEAKLLLLLSGVGVSASRPGDLTRNALKKKNGKLIHVPSMSC